MMNTLNNDCLTMTAGIGNRHTIDIPVNSIVYEGYNYEKARIEDLLHSFARENGFSEFSNKWEKKPYSDDDHTLYNMTNDMLELIQDKL